MLAFKHKINDRSIIVQQWHPGVLIPCVRNDGGDKTHKMLCGCLLLGGPSEPHVHARNEIYLLKPGDWITNDPIPEIISDEIIKKEYVEINLNEIAIKPKIKRTSIINFFAGPGAGKSTLSAGLFRDLKMGGYDVELVREFAKDVTWEGNKVALSNQLFVTANQHHRQQILLGKVDAIVTDSPLLLGVFYGVKAMGPSIGPAFERLVVEMFSSQDNLNFFVKRVKQYNPNGRNQTELEAKELDNTILDVLTRYKIPFVYIVGDENGQSVALKETIKHIQRSC